MSGDVQPRKRNKDKKRRRGNEKDHFGIAQLNRILCLHFTFSSVKIPAIDLL